MEGLDFFLCVSDRLKLSICVYIVLTIIKAKVRMKRESTANAATVKADIAEYCPMFRLVVK